jgi:Zn-dependent peptidase ImmA (M78 family)
MIILNNKVCDIYNIMSFLNDERKAKLKKFAIFVIKELEIENAPTIIIQNGRGELKTTANYDYKKENKIIKVNAHKRALIDVMRSLAHELVHHKQWERGDLEVPPPDIGGPIEDEANAKAGQFIKMFAKMDKTIYDE